MDEKTQSDGSMDLAFGQRLERVRERRGLSRAQLAESSGIELATIEQIESGEHSPRLIELRQLASAFGLRVSELFEDRDEP